MRFHFLLVALLLVPLTAAPVFAQTTRLNNVKKEFIPAIAGTTKAVTRNGITSQYVTDQAVTISVGVQPFDDSVILLRLYIKNGGSEPISIDPLSIQCSGTSSTGNVSLAVLDPIKRAKEALGNVQLGSALLGPGLANSNGYKAVPTWYTIITQKEQAFPSGEILPGEQVSGIVLLQQPYGPVVAEKRGPTSASTQTEIYFSDFSATIPVGGRDYSFAFTVNNDKK